MQAPDVFLTPATPHIRHCTNYKANMSRLPTLSTPGRSALAGPSTGIPTPTQRRTRSSLGAGNGQPLLINDEAMDQALQEALRTRPPSSLKASTLVRLEGTGDPNTPTQPLSLLKPDNGLGLGPRTPGLRPRTPATPSSRAVSRASTSSRPSISSAQPFTPRRTSMASSTTSNAPYARRPESRASVSKDSAYGGGEGLWIPAIGERVKLSGTGMEATVRFYGDTQFKGGCWAGVEFQGGFAGKGKNDGSVDGSVLTTAWHVWLIIDAVSNTSLVLRIAACLFSPQRSLP
jgi:hypothetical protein